jgi:hypothetical protein
VNGGMNKDSIFNIKKEKERINHLLNHNPSNPGKIGGAPSSRNNQDEQ